MEDPETKMMKDTPYELLKDDEKKKLGKNNEAKMTLYNVLPRKEYERVFMCKTAKEFSISDEETIDSGFTRFNAIVTSLKFLDQYYSSKNQVKKFLRLRNDLENDGVASKTTKEKIKSLAFKAKVNREQTSDDSDSQGGSDEDIDEEESKSFNLDRKELLEDDNEPQMDATCLMAIDCQEVSSKPSSSNNDLNIIDLQKENGELLRFNKDFSKTYEKLLQEKHALEKEHSKLFSKVSELELEVKKLVKSKEMVEPCKKFDVLTKEVDSLKCNVSRLQDEALIFSKFKKSSVVLDDMLSRQKMS
ncbi:hypothetical protein Tco_1136517 [Tanacetum coccineum]